jgi:hypothetical protein
MCYNILVLTKIGDIMATYTVILTNHSDDYKRPSTTTEAVLSTSNYTEAMTVAANAWLEEFQNDFVYDNTTDSPFINELKDMLADDPPAETIVDFFESNYHHIWEPEFIHDPWFNVSIQQTEDDMMPSLNIDIITELMSVNK